MTMFDAYLVTWIGVMAAQAAPGPNFVAVASGSLSDGRRTGLLIVVGIASGMLVWSTLTAFGLAQLLNAFPFSLIAMRFLGGAYLIWMALKAAQAAFKGADATIRPDAPGMTAVAAWRRGFFVVMTNPKAGLMWAAVATFLFGNGLTAGQVLFFGPMGALSGLLIYGMYAVLFSTRTAMVGYSKWARVFETVIAGAFGLLGGKLVLDGLRELRG